MRFSTEAKLVKPGTATVLHHLWSMPYNGGDHARRERRRLGSTARPAGHPGRKTVPPEGARPVEVLGSRLGPRPSDSPRTAVGEKERGAAA